MELVLESNWFKVYDNVLSGEYCDKLIDFSTGLLFKQPLDSAPKGHYSKNYRTSNQCFLQKDSDIVNDLDTAAEYLTKINRENFESTSIIRYQEGQEYKPHNDFFNKESPHYNRMLQSGGNRIATALFYLNDNFGGGETQFIMCDELNIVPKKGRCVIWHNLLEQMVFGKRKLIENKASYHSGLPVLSGEKWIATKWIRENKCTL